MENRIFLLFFVLVALSFLFTGVSLLLLRLRSKYGVRVLPVFWILLFLVSVIPANRGSSAVELALYTNYTGGMRIEFHEGDAEAWPEDAAEVAIPYGALRIARGVCATVLFGWFLAGTASVTFGLAGYFDGMQYLTRHSAVCRDERVGRIYAEAKKKVGIRREIPLRIMKPGVRVSPCTCGILFPNVYIGADCPEEYSDLWLEMLFMHELTHVRHGDTPMKLLTLFATGFHSLLPMAKVVRHAVTEDIEYLCDEAVLDRMGDRMRGEYVAMIIREAERNLKKGRAELEILPGLSNDGNAILKRYNNMKARHDPRRNTVRVVPVLFCGVLVNGLMMSAVGVRDIDNLGVDFANPVLETAVCRYFGVEDGRLLTEAHLAEIYSIEFSRPGFPEDRRTFECTLNDGFPWNGEEVVKTDMTEEGWRFTADDRVMDTRDIVLFGGLRTLIFSDATLSSVEDLYTTTEFAVIER